MLTLEEKRNLTDYIYDILREGMFEDILERAKKDKKKRKHRSNSKDDKDEKVGKKKKTKRQEVMSWLTQKSSNGMDSYAVNHAEIMRKLWHPEDEAEEDELRSLFSRKLRHEDNGMGSFYEFDEDEINKLYGIMSDFSNS